MHRAAHRATTEQIGAGAAQLACTQTGQHEPMPALLLAQRVHDRQHAWCALHLVELDDGRSPQGRDTLAHRLGSGFEGAFLDRVEQVDRQGVGEGRAQPGPLAGAARTERKKCPAGGSRTLGDPVIYAADLTEPP